jgi:hypothetical protein
VRHLPKARALAVALVLAGTACTAAPAPAPARSLTTTFVIPVALPNGRAELTIAPSYPRGATLAVPITVLVSNGTISGPVTARVLASGINEAGLPAEVLVRELATAPVTVSGGRGTTTVTWDTLDRTGTVVPADAYSLVLEFRSGDGTIAKAGATLEIR